MNFKSAERDREFAMASRYVNGEWDRHHFVAVPRSLQHRGRQLAGRNLGSTLTDLESDIDVPFDQLACAQK